MATVNTSTITNTLPDPEFVTKSFRFILDRGIMGLGSGILKSRDGNHVAVVLPELHDDDNYSNEDLLKEMMSKFTPKRKNEFMMIPNHSSAVSANQPRGHKSTNLKTAGIRPGVPHPWDDFRQTSIRIIVFLSSGSYDAINYQEV